MSAWMHSRHHHVLQEREPFHSEGFVKVLPNNIHADIFVGNRLAVLTGGAEKHPGRVVVFVIDYIHLVVPVILDVVLFFLLLLRTLQHHNLVFSLSYHLFLHLLGLLVQVQV